MNIQEGRERISGTHGQWYRRLFPLYGSWKKRQLEARIRKEQKRVLRRVAFAGGLCLAFVIWGLAAEGIKPQAGGVHHRTLLEEGGRFTLEYRGNSQEIQVDVSEKNKASHGSPDVVLKEARRFISREMLGENPDWNKVSGPLVFPRQLESGVSVSYDTSNPQRISSQGKVDGIGAGEGEKVFIDVTMIYQGRVESYGLECTVIPPQTEEEIQQALAFRAEKLEKALNNGEMDEELLHDSLGEVRVSLSEENYDPWVISGVMALLLVLIVMSRFSQVEKEREEKRRQLAEELPLFMDQLILMMNAGLILSEALEMVAFSNEGEENVLHWDLRFLCQRAEEIRRPAVALFCEYAVETGCPELIRCTTMLLDHMNRGSDALIQQLKMERNYAMESQWKRKEGHYRKMEVKLSGPLFLILGAILMVSIGPVMIGI